MFRRETFHDLECLTSDEATIVLQGAHLTRFRDWLYLSPHSHFASGQAIRGGVPIVFPWFGPKAGEHDAPAHGWARTALWQVVEAANDGLSVTLELPNPDVLASIQYGFGDDLEMRFEVENRGEGDFRFECALHTYFAVSDVRGVRLEGLDGKTYRDKPSGGTMRTQSGDIAFGGEVDRVYFDASGPIAIRDAARTIHIQRGAGDRGWRSTVVWNPAAERAATMTDLGADQWPHFVCVESGAIGSDAITLAPNEVSLMHLHISVESK